MVYDIRNLDFPRAPDFAVLNPATGAEVGRAPNMGSADLEAAVSRAKAAFAGWSTTNDDVRRSACVAITNAIKAHAVELAELITREQGKPLNGLGSRWEVDNAIAWSEYTAALSLPVKVLQDNHLARIEMHRKPIGVVGSITPWNFPVMIAIWHIIPALRTGNTVIIKPSPNTPLSTLKLVKILEGILPAGVLNVVTGDDKDFNLGAAMAAHPDIGKIIFTGSCATGQKIMRSAAQTTKRLTLEMGGNDAGIVLPDADPSQIVENLFWGAFINNGQTCANIKRLYVHEPIHDTVCDLLVNYAKGIPVGNGLNENNLLGPLQNQMQHEKITRLVQDSIARGKVLLGGEQGDGLFFPPTIIAGLKNGDPLVDEEQFGPALPIISYSDVKDAIRFANDSLNGLGGSVWSSNIHAAKLVAAQMSCGSVWINKHGAIQPNAPFGGVKRSGIGVEFGEEGLAEYTDIQVIFQ